MLLGTLGCIGSFGLVFQGGKVTLLKWVKDLNIRPKTIKLLEENRGEISLTLVLAMIFLIGHQKHKNQKQNLTGTISVEKAFLNQKKQQIKRQRTEWEKIFANNVSHKELISKLYKELI